MRLTEEQAFGRYERADAIISDYERQYDYQLPESWKLTITSLLLHGLTDPELHGIFETIVGVEIQAGRLPVREVDYAAWAKEDAEAWPKKKRR